MPPTCPRIQLFGSGLGQAASTVKVGISAAAAGRGGMPSETAAAATSEQIVAKRAAVRGEAANICVMASSLLFFVFAQGYLSASALVSLNFWMRLPSTSPV